MTQQASRDSTVLLQSIWFATHRRNLTKRSCLKSLLLNDSTSKPWLHSIAAEYMICYTEEESGEEELFKIFPAEWLNKQAVTLSSNPVVLSYQIIHVTSSYSFAYVFLHITRSTADRFRSDHTTMARGHCCACSAMKTLRRSMRSCWAQPLWNRSVQNYMTNMFRGNSRPATGCAKIVCILHWRRCCKKKAGSASRSRRCTMITCCRLHNRKEDRRQVQEPSVDVHRRARLAGDEEAMSGSDLYRRMLVMRVRQHWI